MNIRSRRFEKAFSLFNPYLKQQNRSLGPAQHRSHGDEARTMPLMTWNDPRFPTQKHEERNKRSSCYTIGHRTSGTGSCAQLLRTPPSSACKSPAPRTQHLAAKGSCIERRPRCTAHGLCLVLTAPAGHILPTEKQQPQICVRLRKPHEGSGRPASSTAH